MDSIGNLDSILPPSLMAEVEAVAAAERRSAREMVREAVELYLLDRRPVTSAAGGLRTPLQAATRMLERRRHHPLPVGESIRDLMSHGRA